MSEPAPPVPVSFGEAMRIWVYVALNSFGGPAGQIAMMHREIVERRGWLDERRFLHALNFCMLVPGPEAQQLATYIGWLFHGVRGGLVAGILFVLPGAVVLMTLSIVYAGFHDTTLVQALCYGIKPAVIAVVAEAAVRLARRALKGRANVAIALAAFVAIFFLDVPFPFLVIGAGLAGALLLRGSTPAVGPGTRSPRPHARRSLAAVLIGLALWTAPTAGAIVLTGPTSIFTQLALFFSFAAVITFGGAYAILAFVAQQAVDVFGWLSAPQMVDGLGLAESTPGPLIMVVQFVGFIAAFGAPTGLDPFVAGALGGLLVTWVTFVPSLTFIFAGAPYAEYVRERPGLSAALAGVTAAVVGVIANLALFFALHTLFRVNGESTFGILRIHTVDIATLDVFALALAVASYICLARLRWPLLVTLAASAAAGCAWYVVTGPR
ncbi:MAG: chromate efflux transporter [Candidatus Limnocylindrales bacterium]